MRSLKYCNMRVGTGFDWHKLTTKRQLVLGGVRIESELGALGHSDGDALLHSICDALLGAMGLGDIGEHFPDTDPAFRDIDSSLLLEAVRGMLERRGFEVVNIDTTVFLDAPKLSPYKEVMRQRIAGLLGMPPEQVSVKAKTFEGMSSEPVVIAHAVALLAEKGESLCG